MLLSVLGTYADGAVKLDEKPVGVKRARVVVTLLPEDVDEDSLTAMELSRNAFSEWDNDTDCVYDSL